MRVLTVPPHVNICVVPIQSLFYVHIKTNQVQHACVLVAAVLCFGSMLQVDWQQEAARARSLLVAAHKAAMPLDALLQRPSLNPDLEAPRGSAASLEPVPEQTSLPGTTAPMCFMFHSELQQTVEEEYRHWCKRAC